MEKGKGIFSSFEKFGLGPFLLSVCSLAFAGLAGAWNSGYIPPHAAHQEVFLSNDTARSKATYVIQFVTTVKGHVDKISIAFPPGTNLAKAVLGRVMVRDRSDEDDGVHKHDDRLRVDPSDPDTLIVDLNGSRRVKRGSIIRIELYNLTNPEEGSHTLQVETLDHRDRALETISLQPFSTYTSGPGDVTAVIAGTGLSGGGASGDVTLHVDTFQMQRRVEGICAPGSAIREIDIQGKVVCETDDNSGGTITGVTAGAGLTGGGQSGAVTLSIGGSYQLPQTCSGGEVAKWNGSTWACAADDNSGGDITAVNTPGGSGLTGGAQSGEVTLSIGGSYQLPQGCAAGQVPKSNGAGVWTCATDTDTTYTAGPGLTLGGMTFSLDETYADNRYVNAAGDTITGNLNVTGNLSGGTLSGNGAGLTNLNASNLASGMVPSERFGGSYSNQVNFSNVGNSFTGSFSGNGSGLTNLNLANLSPGTASINISGSAASATTATSFTSALAGDVTGTQNATTVEKIRGINVSSTKPNTGQVLKYDGAYWAPASETGGGGVTAITASLPLVSSGGNTPNISLPNVNIGGSSLSIGSFANPPNTGTGNTAIGTGALRSVTGNGNTAIGFQAGSSQTFGSNNIYVNNAGLAGESNTIRVGASHSRTFIAGIRNVGTGSADGIPVLIDSFGQLGTVSSSRRYKEEIRDMGEASSGLFRLRPVTFQYKAAPVAGSRRPEYGLIAEEVAEVYPDLVVYASAGEVETVQYQKLVPMLLNELQRQQRQLDSQKAEINELKARLDALANLVSAQQAIAQK